jgi:ankyrin repeat protein
MSDAIPLLPRPNLGQYKKLAKELQVACNASEASAIRDWAVRWLEAIARLQGRKLTRALHKVVEREADRIDDRWRKFGKTKELAARCKLTTAQFFIAREHGFVSWPRFVRHLEGLAVVSPVSTFEAAADAIVAGDETTLKKLLSRNSNLVRARSTREHRSTLLHYVSANGIENFRQKTPKNIVEITKLLIKGGADVEAVSDAYGGGWTTLGLAATSIHPEQAGVQIALLQTLLDHGARIGQTAVKDCLANGCWDAAEFLASRGAQMDLEAAAGVGRLDVVKGCFKNGALKPEATRQQMESGFLYACGYGRREVVEFLLGKGVDPGVHNKDGQTGLHWASSGRHADIVKLLLQHGTPPIVMENTLQETPLDWALHAWSDTSDPTERKRYCEVVALLVGAGAKLDFNRYEKTGKALLKKLRSDHDMLVAMRGELPR